MQFGVHVFPTEHSIQPDELARAAEDRGLDSVWFSEHTHIPVRSLHPPDRPAPLAPHYWQTYDIFIAMMLAASATRTIKVASGISLVIEHDPILLAKETATLDLLSKGRFIFGIGAGWLDTEMADHGVVYRTRFLLIREQIRAIKEIWGTEESEFHGKFVNFDKMLCFPKPIQKPHPPIIMGGEGEKAVAVAAELCDGWSPWLQGWEITKATIAGLKQQAAALGRDPAALEISLFEKAIPEPKILAEMEGAGVKRLILTILGQSREEALPRLDQLAKVIHP